MTMQCPQEAKYICSSSNTGIWENSKILQLFPFSSVSLKQQCWVLNSICGSLEGCILDVSRLNTKIPNSSDISITAFREDGLHNNNLYTVWQNTSNTWFTLPGVLLQTNFNFNPSNRYVITSIINCGMKLLIHSQTSTVAPLKFRNG